MSTLGSRCRTRDIVQVQRIHQHGLCDYDCSALEVHGLPAIIPKISYVEHPSICVLRSLREKPFEVGEKWRVVESPF